MQSLVENGSRSRWTGLSEGRLPAADERGKVVISERIRDHLQLGKRKYFSLFRPDLTQLSFETVGVFDAKWDIVTGDLMLMNLEDGRNLFTIPKDSVTDLLVDVGNPNELDTIAEKIAERLPGTRVITRNQILKT